MPYKITRRDFIKLAGFGVAASTIYRAAEEARDSAQFVHNLPWSRTTGAIQDGVIATTCPGCAVHCGLWVHMARGRVQKITGNPDHPINQGLLCPQAESTVLSYGSSACFTGPMVQSQRGLGIFSPIDWKTAESVVECTFREMHPSEIAFLSAPYPDHLDDFLSRFSAALGGLTLFRAAKHGDGDGAQRLREASQKVFGASQIPNFDTNNADLVLAFGVNGSEPWLSSLSKLTGSAKNRASKMGKPVKWIHFSSCQPDLERFPGHWIAVKAGSEVRLADALAGWVAATIQGVSQAGCASEIETVSQITSLSASEVLRLVESFISAEKKVAAAGSVALRNSEGYEMAESVFKLNIAADNLGKPGGLFFTAPAPIYPYHPNRISSTQELAFLIERIKYGGIKTLFVHGSPLKPGSDLFAEFVDALKQVPQIISFSASLDEITRRADFIFPDQHIFESWGYQKVSQGNDRAIVSGFQPIFQPAFDSRATMNVLLNVIARLGGNLQETLPYQNQDDFLQKALGKLCEVDQDNQRVGQKKSIAGFFERGGWWNTKAATIPPVSIG